MKIDDAIAEVRAMDDRGDDPAVRARALELLAFFEATIARAPASSRDRVSRMIVAKLSAP